MKALIYRGPGERAWEKVSDPHLVDDTDIIVKVDTTTICGTDLHILKGDVPEVQPGTILGHEGVGTVVEVGAAVKSVAHGDRVLISCISACGQCRFCREARYGLCTGGGGWILGHTIDGTQAQYARIPFADTSVYKVPEELSDEQVLFLSDILPTAYEVGILAGDVSPGDTIAVIGAGPVGLAAILTARLFSPTQIIAIDPLEARRTRATAFGATLTLSGEHDAAVAAVFGATAGLGVDLAIEAVGAPETFELATELVRPGGRVANVGVHGHPAMLHLEKLWARDITITMGLVDTSTTARLLELVRSGQLDATVFATHRFKLANVMEAYDVFERAGETDALKVVLEAEAHGLVQDAGTKELVSVGV